MCLDGGRGKDVEGKGVLWAVWLYTFSCLNLFIFFNSLKLGEFGEGEIPNLGHFLGIFIFTLN